MPKKDEIKAKFVISLKNVFNLEDCDGKTIFVAWKRGSKGANSGETKKVAVSGKIVVFGEEITLDSTLLQDTKSKKWESKKIEFVLKEEVKKKTKPLGKATVDLAEYNKNGQTYEAVAVPFTFKKKKDKAPSLKLGIRCTWTHLNKKKILAAGVAGKNSVEIDGERIVVGETEEDFSDEATTAGDHSSGEASDFEDDDFKEQSGKSTSKGSPRHSKEASKPHPAPVLSDDPKKRAAELEKLLEEKDKALRKSESEVAKLKEDLAKEKEKSREKFMRATGSKEEVKKLKKELADAKKKGISTSSDDLSTHSAVASLKEQVEALTAEKNALAQELSAAKRNVSSSASGKVDKALEDKDREIAKLKEELQKVKNEAEKQAKSADIQKKDFDGKGKGGEETVSKREYEKVMKSLQKRNNEVVQLEKESKEKEKEIETLKEDGERLEKNLKGLLEVSDNKKGPAGNDNGVKSPPGNDNSAQLTKENKELKQKIERQDKEMAKLKSQVQELEEASRKSTPSAGGGGGGDLEALKQKLKKMEIEKEEMCIIEDHIYCMTAKYEDGIHVSAQQITDIMMEKGALEDPPNERLLARILNAMKKCYQADSYDNNTLVPWLSFACMLHESLETEIGTSEDANSGDIPTNGVHIPREGESHDDDDEDPVTTFFHNLEMLIFEIYSAVLRNFYTQLNEVVVAGVLQLSSCIMENRSGKQPPSKNDLKSFTPVLTDCYMLLKRHAVFDSVLQQFFCQAFYFINASLFNNLLKKRELCTCASGFRIKLGLSQLEEWTNTTKVDKKIITDPKKDKKILSFAARNYLKHVTEAATVLVFGKDIFLDEKAIFDAFPTLTPSQIKHLLQSFQPDQFSPDPVPKKVMTILDRMIAGSDSEAPFELDESYLLSLQMMKHE